MRYIYFLLVVFMLSSCDDYLDIVPKGKFIPQNTIDYERMLNGRELLIGHRLSFGYACDDAFLTEGYYNKTLPENKIVYFFDKWNLTSKDEVWNNIYKNIFTYNAIIEGVMDSKNGSDKLKKQVLGEALLGRAFEYFMAINIYAKHYNKTTASMDKGVPIILKSDINQKDFVQNSVEQVYDRIEADLNEAIKYLPEDIFNMYRGSRLAVLGFKARVSLYKSDYESAFKYADQVLAKYNYLEDYNNYEVIDNEAIFGRTNIIHSWECKENIYSKHLKMKPGVSNLVVVSNELQSLFDDSDKRWDLFFSDYDWRNGDLLPVGRKVLHKYDYETNFAVTVPMLYLIRAEYYARNNEPKKAMDDINYLREYRIKKDQYIRLIANDEQEALRIVLEERRRETAFDCNRWFDLKRLNLAEDTEVTIVRTIGEKTVVLEPNDPRYVVPIPDQVLEFHQEWVK